MLYLLNEEGKENLVVAGEIFGFLLTSAYFICINKFYTVSSLFISDEG